MDHHDIRNCVLGFKCDQQWGSMELVKKAPFGDYVPSVNIYEDNPSEVRFCSKCQKNVYECQTDEELQDNIWLNRCVSIKPPEWDEDFRLNGMVRILD